MVQTRSGAPLAARAWATQGAFERVHGWLGRASAGPGEGLLISPCASLHTFGMRFPLDAAFLDRGGRVLKVALSVPPGRLVWGPPRGLLRPWSVRALELPAGTLASAGVGPGTELVFLPRAPQGPA